MTYYFAFGPDLGPADISGLLGRDPAGPALVPLAVAKLNDYALVFKHPAGLAEPVADIIPSPDECVYGLLYEFQTDDLAKLNAVRQPAYRSISVVLTIESVIAATAPLWLGRMSPQRRMKP